MITNDEGYRVIIAKRDEVLNKLSMKEDAFKKQLNFQDLSEDDFVQLLNLETKKNIIKDGETSGLFFGIRNKAREIIRTFKTSYKNDTSKNRLGNALLRAVKYPVFKAPLMNKMSQDINFNATQQEREKLGKELKEKRVNKALDHLSALKFSSASCAVLMGLGYTALKILPVMVNPAAHIVEFTVGLAASAACGAAVLGPVLYLGISSEISEKKPKGPSLLEQALENEKVKQKTNTNDMTRNVELAAPDKSDLKAKMLENSLSAKEMAKHSGNSTQKPKEQQEALQQKDEKDKDAALVNATIKAKQITK